MRRILWLLVNWLSIIATILMLAFTNVTDYVVYVWMMVFLAGIGYPFLNILKGEK